MHQPDAIIKWGIKPIVKVTVALRMLLYGTAANCNNKYLQLSESTSLESMDEFCTSIVQLFSSEYF